MKLTSYSRKNINGARHYVSADDKTLAIGVTSLIKKFVKKDLTSWYISLGKKYIESMDNTSFYSDQDVLNLGKIEGDKIKEACRLRGDIFHAEIENYYLGNIQKPCLDKESFSTLITQYLEPSEFEDSQYGVEIELIGQSNCKSYSFGGTTDFHGTLKGQLVDFNTQLPINVGNVIVDWKNTYSVKRPMYFKRSSKSKEFPLTEYFLQTVAYTAAFNQLCESNSNYKVKDNLVVVNPVKSKDTIYIYYCDAPKVAFYWEKFQDLLHCHYEGKTEYNWAKLNAEIEYYNMIPVRVNVIPH